MGTVFFLFSKMHLGEVTFRLWYPSSIIFAEIFRENMHILFLPTKHNFYIPRRYYCSYEKIQCRLFWCSIISMITAYCIWSTVPTSWHIAWNLVHGTRKITRNVKQTLHEVFWKYNTCIRNAFFKNNETWIYWIGRDLILLRVSKWT